jgi:hypothetical protein
MSTPLGMNIHTQKIDSYISTTLYSRRGRDISDM